MISNDYLHENNYFNKEIKTLSQNVLKRLVKNSECL